MAEEKAKRYQNSSEGTDGHAYCANYGAHKPGITPAEVAEYYSNWAEKYENDINPERYLGPSYVCKTMADTYPAATTNRSAIKILDIACGTGYIGEKLREQGFTNVDGLDPSEKMLDIAKSKNVYKTLYCEFMSDAMLPINKGTYDCIVISGGMGEGHVPCAALNEMIRIVKSGGHVIIAMREEYLTYVEDYVGRLEPTFLKLETEGRWTNISRTVVTKYSFDNQGIIFKYRVC